VVAPVSSALPPIDLIARSFFTVRAKEPFLSFFFFLVVLGFELRAYTLSHSTCPFFVMGFFEMESPKLFAQAGFKAGSS
jgi:hypothetical protein